MRPAATFVFSILLSVASLTPAFSQNFRGKDGPENYTLGINILNRYTTLAAPHSAGSLTVTVTDINQLNGASLTPGFVNPYASNSLSKGDLIMIIQVQGADIATTDDANYGAVTDYNTTGNYELRTVFSVSGNTISLCQNLSKSYGQGGRARTQVIRVPRLTTLTVGSLASITGLAWDGTIGGVVALETSGAISLSGSISANAIGFRGGIDDKNSSVTSGGPALLLYRTTISTTTASKGEGIAGNPTDYNTLLNGNYGRGAPANGGGGGNGHNSGGGGGSNAGTNGVLTPWNGTGKKNTSTPAWANAWNLEYAGFATDVSTGAGRGGYSYSNTNQDALTIAPGNAAWGGDKRNIVGGFGGRPLNYFGNTRLFMGGGGGAGDGNNNAPGDGGKGGGIVYLLSTGSITGSGTITANGENGFNTASANIDAAGGGGGGGAIVANMSGTITGVTLSANGGNGGNQLLLLSEAEGPGGGGGGGYISTVSTATNRNVLGGDNGTSASAQVTEFLPNGATQGSNGTVVNRTFMDIYYCDAVGTILPIKLQSFTASLHEDRVILNWVTETETPSSYFEVEKSSDGQHFNVIAVVMGYGTTNLSNYSYQDKINISSTSMHYYRIRTADATGKYSYSTTRAIRLTATTSTGISTYPNPALSAVNVTIPATWQGQQIRFEIFDVAGRRALSTLASFAGQTESISLKSLNNGIYIVRATNGDQVMQQRIVKQ